MRERFGTPCYVYDQRTLEASARAALEFPAPFGFTLRYAMKANPSLGVLRLFRDLGLHIDASSDFEVARAMRAGFKPEQIQLTSQAPSKKLPEWVKKGVRYNACSLYQLEEFGKAAPGGRLSVRLNPGLGSGGTNRTNTGGPASSFGIWHEHTNDGEAHRRAVLPDHRSTPQPHRLRFRPRGMEARDAHDAGPCRAAPRRALRESWRGFEVGRVPSETTTDLQDIGRHIERELLEFQERDGRTLHMESGPGTWLVALAGMVVSTCIDVVDTGADGYVFAKLDTGMTEVTRPALYGAQHPISVISDDTG